MRRLWRTYAAALREEPKMRAYLGGAIVDDIGIAVSAWAMMLLQTNLFHDQRERAKLMLPMLVCFLLGTVVGGPLADWARHGSPGMLGRWRWRLVLWARGVETLALSVVIFAVAGGQPTLERVLPYFLVSAFMKTALGPTRIAFRVDLLRREQVQVDADGAPVLDELGGLRAYKVHLLTFSALPSFLRGASTFAGLILGGAIMARLHGRYVPLFVFDVVTNLGFIAFVFFGCHPDRAARGAHLGELLGHDAEAGAASVRAHAHSAGRSMVAEGLREFVISLREAVQFLRRPEQRPLCWLLLGAWVVEVVNEFYDGRMIVRHVLHGSDDAVRYSELVWSAATIVIVALIPALARRVGNLGKIFLATMLVDGIVIALAGRVCGTGATAAIVPFGSLIALDRGLTETSNTLVELAQNSASSAAIRGRIAASYAFVVIISDMFAEGAATALADAFGIPGMLTRVGAAQVALMIVVAALGGSKLWSFGIRSTERAALARGGALAAQRGIS
jgi:hypothetical protein